MNLPSSLNWIDVDLPDILNYKQAILANEKPNCELRTIQMDLSDRISRIELFRQLGIFDAETLQELSPLPIKNRRGDIVGRVCASWQRQ